MDISCTKLLCISADCPIKSWNFLSQKLQLSVISFRIVLWQLRIGKWSHKWIERVLVYRSLEESFLATIVIVWSFESQKSLAFLSLVRWMNMSIFWHGIAILKNGLAESRFLSRHREVKKWEVILDDVCNF